MSANKTLSNKITPESPIYILGENALSFYLAEKFISAGEKVIILSPDIKKEKSIVDISIKENQSLKKHKFSYIAEHYTYVPGKLLIITTDVKADLTLLSPKTLAKTPFLIFSYQSDLTHIEKLFNKHLVRGYLNGWLKLQDQQVKAFSDIKIILNKNYDYIDDCLQALGILQRTNLTIISEENGDLAFWTYFIPYAINSTLSAYHQQNIFQILKSKDNHKKLDVLAHEFSSLADANGVNIDTNDIIKHVFNTPIEYKYPTQENNPSSVLALNQLHRSIINLSAKSKNSLSQYNKMMKELYLRINSF